MNVRRFSTEELEALLYASKYYMDDASTQDDGSVGLPKGSKERRILRRARNKLKERINE